MAQKIIYTMGLLLLSAITSFPYDLQCTDRTYSNAVLVAKNSNSITIKYSETAVIPVENLPREVRNKIGFTNDSGLFLKSFDGFKTYSGKQTNNMSTMPKKTIVRLGHPNNGHNLTVGDSGLIFFPCVIQILSPKEALIGFTVRHSGYYPPVSHYKVVISDFNFENMADGSTLADEIS